MNVIRNERVIPVDVDGTLVMHEQNISMSLTPVYVENPVDGNLVKLYKNLPMIKLLKEEVYRGAQVIVWSKGGFEWAEAVLKALQLDLLPITVMTKPIAYFDDKDVSEWLKDRVYLTANTAYKQGVN